MPAPWAMSRTNSAEVVDTSADCARGTPPATEWRSSGGAGSGDGGVGAPSLARADGAEPPHGPLGSLETHTGRRGTGVAGLGSGGGPCLVGPLAQSKSA